MGQLDGKVAIVTGAASGINERIAKVKGPRDGWSRTDGPRADLAGIANRIAPHRLRYSVATTLVAHGIPLEQMQQFLGSSVPQACPIGHDPNLYGLHHRHDAGDLSAGSLGLKG